MNTIEVLIGRIDGTASGLVQDSTRKVEFEGEELATLTLYDRNEDGRLTDLRGVKEALYRTDDGRLIVHSEDWSKWAGEPTEYELIEVTEGDLQPGGRFDRLGEQAGFGRSLTLDEALEQW